jgi:Family of unknown function (DUF6428)
MKLSEFKNQLSTPEAIQFVKSNGEIIPQHFHITEIGQVDKKYMDCGGTVRHESRVSIQLWKSVDVWHRLTNEAVLKIIAISENQLAIQDAEIEVEYQGDTIEKFDLNFNGKQFVLGNIQTACLAVDQCGVSVDKIKKQLSELAVKAESCCAPGSGCC